MPKIGKGTKTIKLAIYFWTDVGSTGKSEGIELPKKTCWDSGFVNVVSNNRHGIRSGTYKNFRYINELPEAINDVLRKSGIKVVSSKKNREYKEALRQMKDAEIISNQDTP